MDQFIHGDDLHLTEEVKQKVMNMFTDPKRIRTTDPGTIAGNPMFIYLDAFGTASDGNAIQDMKVRYTEGTIGDIEVKRYLVEVMERFLDPIRARRKDLENNPQKVEHILKKGTERARHEISKTLHQVRKAFFNYQF